MSRIHYYSVMGLLIALVALWGLFAAGCAEPSSRLNAPPQGNSEKPNELQKPYIHMTDNALLEDMSVSSVHFVPHRIDLNSLGVRRLKRYAEILKIYGGTLKYDGTDEPQPLINQRMEQIKNLLVAEGLSKDQFEIDTGMAGGKGANASEAIVVRQASRIKPVKENSGGDKNSGQSISKQ